MFISIGQIVNTHGIRGEVKVVVYSDRQERFEGLRQVFVTGPAVGAGAGAGAAGPRPGSGVAEAGAEAGAAEAGADAGVGSEVDGGVAGTGAGVAEAGPRPADAGAAGVGPRPAEAGLGAEAGRRVLTITGVRYHKGMALLTFAEVGDMAAAQRLRGCFLQVPAADLPPLPEGRYYIYQLVGLSVWEKDVCLGALTEVLQPGSNDVYIVREGSREILVPALKSVIKGVDLAARRMDVELPAGLLELYGG